MARVSLANPVRARLPVPLVTAHDSEREPPPLSSQPRFRFSAASQCIRCTQCHKAVRSGQLGKTYLTKHQGPIPNGCHRLGERGATVRRSIIALLLGGLLLIGTPSAAFAD